MAVSTHKILKNSFEKTAWADSLYTCGIDEVGRGCLTGPVVVGAVILPLNKTSPLLKDSKILTEAEREKAFAWIIKHCNWSTAAASHRIIDQRNIYQATLYAMRKACLQLLGTLPFPIEKLKYVLIDAMPLTLSPASTHENLEFHHFPFGEQRSSSIAAASIVAKVTRDRLMQKIDTFYPAFSLGKHKGYATQQHMDALLAHGPTIIHRTSFIKTITTKTEQSDHHEQESLFCRSN